MAQKGNHKNTVGFVLYPERGGYYPTFRIAKALVAQGHRVIYFGTREFENDIRLQGLEYELMFKEKFGAGTFDAPPLNSNTGYFARLKHNISMFRYRNTVLFDGLTSGEITAVFKKHAVDVLLIDALLTPLSTVAHAHGFKVMTIATELVGNGTSLPPHTSLQIFQPDSFLNKLMVSVLWQRFKINNWIKARITRTLANLLKVPAFDPVIKEKFEAIKKSANLRYIYCEYGWRPVFPELVLCPQIFDYPIPGSKLSTRHYMGHCVDTNRSETPLAYTFKNPNNPLVYCSLGTHVADYRHANHFFKQLIEVVNNSPQLNFIVSMGPGRNLADYGPVPANVVSTVRAPQLEILKSAALMITNGGLGTIKECIYFAVPMLILPCNFDQPGNSARVCFHKIGRRRHISTINVNNLSSEINELINNSCYKNNIEAMSIAVREDQNFHTGIRLISEQAAGAAAHPPTTTKPLVETTQ